MTATEELELCAMAPYATEEEIYEMNMRAFVWREEHGQTDEDS